MKKILFAALALILAASCTKDNKCVINGTITEADGQAVYLQYQIGDSTVMDSTVVADGKFTFTCELDVPYRSAALIIGDINDNYGQNSTYCQVALEPGTVTVVAEGGKLTDATITGGKTQTEMNELNVQLKPFNDKFKEFNEKYYALTTEEARDSMNALMEPIRKEYEEVTTKFMKTQTGSFLAPSYLRMKMGNMSYEDIKAVYDAFADNVKLYGDGIDDVKKELVALENVQPGKDAPDFTAKDINGNDFTLSSLKGKAVIIDFWASWCKPCRASNPHMLELYKKYHDKGLEMVYVSDDDTAPDKWREAVQKDGLTAEGFHHVLRGLKWDRSKGMAGIDHTNDISDKYAIHFLPTKYLINREGKMVCKIAEGEDAKLDEQLEALLK
ncbi:MAG: AhpC/TSA family protein [Prevotella sp.]|nr:AhpC/TSA family protein [Prevotella sp.]